MRNLFSEFFRRWVWWFHLKGAVNVLTSSLWTELEANKMRVGRRAVVKP
jgi:hypothetical protein